MRLISRLTSVATIPLVLLAGSSVAPTAVAAARQGQAAKAAGTSSYRMVDLGTLGGESSFATAMNDRGDVVGRSTVADGTFHGFLWRGGRMIDLGSMSPIDINNRRQIVGTLDDRSNAHLWRAGRLTDLGTLGGTFSHATAINDRGDVVGVSATADGPSAPFLWSKGRMRKLPLDAVAGINERRQVAGGRLHGTAGFHAGVLYRGRFTDLGAGPFDRSNTYGINDRGWVIGWHFSPARAERGMLWRGGTATDVGTLGGERTQLRAINDRGQILGQSQVADGNVRPVLWQRGVLTDLTAAGVVGEDTVVDLNDRGDIAASIRPVFGISRAVVYRKVR